MKKDYILFIDSGIGGLSTLAKCMKTIKSNYIYFADNSHAPYGNRSKNEILEFLRNAINDFSQKYNIIFVVIACNTATAAALDDLRAIFADKIFIGTEPAVHFAEKNGCKNVFSLTTPLTKNLIRYQTLCKKQDSKIYTKSIVSLSTIVENYCYFGTLKTRFELLKTVAKIIMQANKFDCIVLGCTHYVFLKPFFMQLSNKKLFDGNDGISRNLEYFLLKKHYKFTQFSSVKFIFSKQKRGIIKKYEKILSQTLANSKILC